MTASEISNVETWFSESHIILVSAIAGGIVLLCLVCTCVRRHRRRARSSHRAKAQPSVSGRAGHVRLPSSAGKINVSVLNDQ